MIRVSAFPWVPDFAQGLVRDLRVRWALEEAGQVYEARLLAAGEGDTPEYRAMQPFGQVPAYEEDGLVLFESAAIVLHVARRTPALMPGDEAGRARTTAWMFAAMNSIEPGIMELGGIDFFHPDEPWAKARRPGAVDMVRMRLADLARWLEGRDYLTEGRFTAADLLMCTVMRILRHTDLVAAEPTLADYAARCEARPAFQRALAAQMATFAEHAPPEASSM